MAIVKLNSLVSDADFALQNFKTDFSSSTSVDSQLMSVKTVMKVILLSKFDSDVLCSVAVNSSICTERGMDSDIRPNEPNTNRPLLSCPVETSDQKYCCKVSKMIFYHFWPN